MNEEAALFGAKESLVGIVTAPRSSDFRRYPAVILLNAGLVHRAGPGRIYVKIARQLASLGLLALRFDFSGIGDSPVRSDTLGFEKSTVAETREAMDYLRQTRGIEHFILLGGCSGAFASFETAACDPRVAGALLINFQMPEAADEAENSERLTRSAAHYYHNWALFDLRSWGRLITGKSDYRQLVRVLRHEVERWLTARNKASAQTSYFQARLGELTDRKTPVVFICSQADSRLHDLRQHGGAQLRRLCARGGVGLDVIRGADHTFTTPQDQERLLKVVCKRIDEIARRTDKPIQAHQAKWDCSWLKSLLRPVEGEELPQSK
jgi:pimeloyl-ACP methyl ester carboxylesterase